MLFVISLNPVEVVSRTSNIFGGMGRKSNYALVYFLSHPLLSPCFFVVGEGVWGESCICPKTFYRFLLLSCRGHLFAEELFVEGEGWGNIVWASVLFACLKNLSCSPLFGLLYDISISFGVLASLTAENSLSPALWFSI